MALNQTRNLPSQPEDNVAIDAAISDPTRPACIGPEPPATATPSRDSPCSVGVQSLGTQAPVALEPPAAKIIEKTVPGRFSCSICLNKKYSWLNDLESHIAKHHGNALGAYKCTACTLHFNTRSATRCPKPLPKPFLCALCFVGFIRIDSANKHHCKPPKGTFFCGSCKKEYKGHGELMVHVFGHSNIENPFQCNCGLHFNSHRLFKKHDKSKECRLLDCTPRDLEDKRMFGSSIEGNKATFNNLAELLKHAGVWQRIRVRQPKSTQESRMALGGANFPTEKYICYYAGCCQVVQSLSSLRRHLWGHSGLQPDDPKAWPRFLESGDKIYGCCTGRCGAGFENLEKLLDHRNSVHYRCPHCKIPIRYAFLKHVESCSLYHLSLSAATSSRGLSTPASTLEMGEDINQGRSIPANNLREDPTIYISKGAPYSSAMPFQPQQPVSLNTYPPEGTQPESEDGKNSGTEYSRSLPGARQSLPPAPGRSIAFFEARPQSFHRQGAKRQKIQEVEYGIHWDQGHMEPVNHMPLEAESGVQPDHQPQQVAENTPRSWISLVLRSPTTTTSDHSIQPLADDSGHTYEPSQARSPLHAGLTASPYSTNELPRHRGLWTAGDDAVRLASELDHPGHPVTALSAVVQSTEGEAGHRAAKPDSSGQSAQPTESRRKFRPRNAIKLLNASPSPPRVTSDPVGGPILISSDGIQSSGTRASWLGRDGAAIYVSDEPSDHLLNGSLTAPFDDEDTGSDTTLAGEEEWRSLTPAPVSGRAFYRAYRQEFEGKGTRTRNIREQQDISELAATLEMEDVDQDQGRGANDIAPASDWPPLPPTRSMEPTAQGDGPSQYASMLTHIADISNPETMPPRNSPTATLHSLIPTQPQQPIHPLSQQLPKLQAPQEDPQEIPSKVVCRGYGECKKEFTRKDHLKRHIKSAHEKTGVKCGACPKIFRGPWDLEQHIISQHGGPGWPCGWCTRTFSRERNLQNHIQRIHKRAVKPSLCSQCGKKYSTKSNLTRHIKDVH